jgi:CBS domain-containing membrane protein
MPIKTIKRNARKVRYVLYKETLLDFRDHLITFIGAFTGIGLIGFINSKFISLSDNLFLIGSFGATSVLIYGIVHSPLAQPRNLIGGHLISALIGVTIYKLIPDPVWLAAALSVAFAIVCMQITKTLHPPGGATAIIACIGSEKIKALGYAYVLSPVLSGVFILFVVAMIVNNIGFNRKYPSHSFKIFSRRK